MSSKVASAIRGAACCGPRGRRAKRSGRCNARAPGSSYPGHRQRPRCWVPYVKPHPRTWHRKGNALLSIANVSACRAGPCDRPKRNLTNCVRDGRRYRLQAQGDFCGIAYQHSNLLRFLRGFRHLTESPQVADAVIEARLPPSTLSRDTIGNWHAVVTHGLTVQWVYNAPDCRLTPSGTLTLTRSQREKEPNHRRARRMEYKVISGDGHIDLRWLPHDLFVSH